MATLHVWMSGEHIATITESRDKMRLVHVPGAAPLGVPLISVAMPMATETYHDKVVRPFFHGLLPEGPARQTIAYDFNVDERDDVGLLAVLGRDCAGALMVLPAGQLPPDADNPPEALDDTMIEQRIRNLAVYPLGVTGKVRASLPGVQPKLLLWSAAGQWFTPDATHPSTHIIKPGIAVLPGTVSNEAFCLNLAAQAGLPAATTSVMHFGGIQVLVSERYDRHVDDTGATIRLQQEDACQALSVLTYLPKHKYQAYGGPNLVDVAAVLTNWGGSLAELLRYITFNVMVGNADLHGKNISFLHDAGPTISLAPMYDVMSTTHYDGADGGRHVDTELGLFIAGQVDILLVTTDDLVAESGRWGMRTAHATRTIGELADAVLAAIDGTVDLLDGAIPAALVERIVARTASFART